MVDGMNKEFGLTHLLAGLCALFASINIGEWVFLRYGISEKKVFMERPVKSNISFEKLGSHDFVLPPEESFEDVIERPLMVRGRRPVDEQQPQKEVAVPVQNQNSRIQLMGVISTPEGMTALLVDGAGKYKRVKLNGQIDGWDVTELQGDKVILVQGASRQELLLRKPKPKVARVPKKKPKSRKRDKRAKPSRLQKNTKKVNEKRPYR